MSEVDEKQEIKLQQPDSLHVADVMVDMIRTRKS